MMSKENMKSDMSSSDPLDDKILSSETETVELSDETLDTISAGNSSSTLDLGNENDNTPIGAQVLCDSPAAAMGNFFVATSQALSNAAHNATSAQQQSNVTTEESTIAGIITLYSV